jgi:hypothetical protein
VADPLEDPLDNPLEDPLDNPLDDPLDDPLDPWGPPHLWRKIQKLSGIGLRAGSFFSERTARMGPNNMACDMPFQSGSRIAWLA